MPCLQIRLLLAILPLAPAGLTLDASEIVEVTDKSGLLAHYSMVVDVKGRAGSKTKQVFGTMYWNLAGRYLRFEPDPENPLRKRNGVAFTDSDYTRLAEILQDRDSLLGHHSLGWLGQPDGADPAPDGISGATPKTLQRTVVKDAAWTTWVLWQHANVAYKEELQQMTAKRASSLLGTRLLNSPDMSECGFGLKLMTEQQVPGDDYLDLVLGALERGDNEIIRSAIGYLDNSVQDRQELNSRLADSCARMNTGYVPMVVRYLAKQPELSTEALENLSGSLQRLPTVSVRMILELLEDRGCYSEQVLNNVTVIKETGSSNIAHLAETFLDAHNEGVETP
ncbi:MAG: hypothetical protein AB3N63_14065 [Puniceicoccaceae bacterium]